MAFNLKGKEEKFFSIMNNHAHLCHEAAQVMEKAFKGETEKEAALSEIDQKEKRADELVNQTMEPYGQPSLRRWTAKISSCLSSLS